MLVGNWLHFHTTFWKWFKRQYFIDLLDSFHTDYLYFIYQEYRLLIVYSNYLPFKLYNVNLLEYLDLFSEKSGYCPLLCISTIKIIFKIWYIFPYLTSNFLSKSQATALTAAASQIPVYKMKAPHRRETSLITIYFTYLG